MNSGNIREELRQMHADALSSQVGVPFQLPEDYFETLADAVFNRIKLEMLPDPALHYLPKAEVYLIPDQYFEKLADATLEKVKMADRIIQHQEVSWPLQKEMPYIIPAGYLDTLPGIVLQQINEDSLPAGKELEQTGSFLPGLKSAFPFGVSPGYFDALPEQVLEKIHNGAELEDPELSPLLAGLREAQPFATPESYFDQHANIAHEITTPPRRVKKLWQQWAVAAGVAALVVFTGWTFFNGQSDSMNQPAMQIAGKATSEVFELQLDKQLSEVSDEEIRRYIENHIDEFDETSLSNAFLRIQDDPFDWKNTLQHVSNQEIRDYLKNGL